MDPSRLKVGEIEEYLRENPELTREIYHALLEDPRRGVKSLLRKWQEKRARDRQEEERLQKMLLLEEEYRGRGYRLIAGVDEAGRGPLAGPVVAAAVILPQGLKIRGVDDSKKLTPGKREELYSAIRDKSLAVGLGVVEPQEIDEINIYRAGLKAFALAVGALGLKPDFILTDAFPVPGTAIPQFALVRGDALSLSIAAASIVAKVTRDAIMDELDGKYPGYGLGQHKGYPTRDHREALRKYGPSPCHRRSFQLLGAEEEALP